MKVYLSRLLLNPHSRQVASELLHPYEMHRTLIRGFEKHVNGGENSARERAGMLFRVDVDESKHRVVAYVQSIVEPDWSHVEELDRYLLAGLGMPGATHRDVSRSYGRLRDGQMLSFRLRANPTKRLGRGADDVALEGKRVGLVRQEDQIAWLERKGRNGGFALASTGSEDITEERERTLALSVSTEGKQTGRKRSAETSHTMTHLSVVFSGLLRITDASVFRETLVQGIGSAKAYGFGLLSLAPPWKP